MNLTRTVSLGTLVASGVSVDSVFRFGRAGSEIDLTENEVRVLRLALIAYQHLGLGAFRTAFDQIQDNRMMTGPKADEVLEVLEAAQETLTGTSKGGPSIGNKLVGNDVRIARRLQAGLEGDKAVFSLYRRDGTVDRT